MLFRENGLQSWNKIKILTKGTPKSIKLYVWVPAIYTHLLWKNGCPRPISFGDKKFACRFP